MLFQFSNDKVKTELERALGAFKERLVRIHTGQANPGVIEDLKVTHQGFTMKLKELASIKAEGSCVLVIEPWDKASVGDIERGLINSESGLHPQVKGSSIYLNFSSLTQETRQARIKEIKEMQEETRITFRHIRDVWWEALKKAQETGDIREDDKFKFKDELQKIVDEYNKKTEDMTERKIKTLE